MVQSAEERKLKAKDRLDRSEVKAKIRERQQSLEYRARVRDLSQTPKYMASAKKYRARPETKALDKARRLIPENIAKNRARTSNPEHKAKKAKSTAKTRLKVLQSYSKHLSNSNIPCCRCCGENSHIDFLALDHIAGKNKMNYEPELIKLGYSSKLANSTLYVWIRDHDFPDGFQVLCTNCNFAKGMKKNKNQCPHEKQRLEETFDRMTTQSSFEL